MEKNMESEMETGAFMVCVYMYIIASILGKLL